jgi:hypothetical protein
MIYDSPANNRYFCSSFYGLLGYLKSNERFSFKKFSRALIIDFGIKVIERKIIKKKSKKSKAHK